MKDGSRCASTHILAATYLSTEAESVKHFDCKVVALGSADRAQHARWGLSGLANQISAAAGG